MDVQGSSTNLASDGPKAQGRVDDHPGSGGRITHTTKAPSYQSSRLLLPNVSSNGSKKLTKANF
eukprot:6060786-Amphidinium_carterae.1